MSSFCVVRRMLLLFTCIYKTGVGENSHSSLDLSCVSVITMIVHVIKF